MFFYFFKWTEELRTASITVDQLILDLLNYQAGTKFLRENWNKSDRMRWRKYQNFCYLSSIMSQQPLSCSELGQEQRLVWVLLGFILGPIPPEISWQLSHVLLCISVLPSPAVMRMKRRAQLSSTKHLFSTISPGSRTSKQMFSLWREVWIPLLSLDIFCKVMWGIWGFDEALKETSALSGISWYPIVALGEHRLSPESAWRENWSSPSIPWSMACPSVPTVNMFCALIRCIRSADVKIIILWCVRKQEHSILIDFLNIFRQIFTFFGLAFLHWAHHKLWFT